MIMYILLNWSSSSRGGRFFVNVLLHVFLFPCKKAWPFHLNKLKSVLPRDAFLPRFVEIDQVVL